MRHKVFDDDMEEEIDVFDLECKEWGFCLRDLFGLGLGTGDYGHLTVEHASMLLRNFRSLRDYSNQGFEASHKLQKQIYSRATNHDGSGEASSLDQILTHHYAERLLFLRLCFRNAKECARKGKKFYFRGCGWSNAVSTKKWSATHKRWIDVMDELFTTFMGKDFLAYRYTEDLSCVVVEEDCPLLEYDDASWDNIGKMKLIERQWLESETPRARKKKKGRIPKKSRRKLFKTRKRKKNSRYSSVVSSSSSKSTIPDKKNASPNLRNAKRKSRLAPSSVNTKRKPPSSTSDSTKSQESCLPQTRRCLFGFSNRKRRQRSPLTTSYPKRKTSLFSTPLATSTLSSDASGPPSPSPLDASPPLSADCSLLSSSPSASTPPLSVFSGQPSLSASATTSPSSASTSLASTIQTTCSTALPPFDHVFSSACPREEMLTCKLPAVDCSVTVQENVLVRVPDNFEYTNVTTLQKRPPACVVNDAVSLIREMRKEVDDKAFIDLEDNDVNVGVSIGKLGVFSRAGLGQLEWLAEVAEMQCNSQEEERWLMHSTDKLDDETRHKIPHTITWLNTGERSFIRQCFEEVLQNVKPGLLSLVLVPVNMDNVHWGLMVLDVKNKEAYFDDGLGYSFSKTSYVFLIMSELQSKFPDCDDFSLDDWRNVKTFKRFGMPRQPTDGQLIGSGSCGVGVILAALDFMTSSQPKVVSRSWNFSEMTAHRKDIMKLLACR
nr:uncharacterized protein LOC131789459 [Pocillopora verrucosa]